DVDLGQSERGELVTYAGERGLKVALDVVGERLERGYVNDARLIRQATHGTLAHQLIDHREEGRESLAGARGSGNQDVALRDDRGPRRALRRRGCIEGAVEPVDDRRMEVGGHWYD